ncbi:hypothetical protein POM88_049960 [Heracleum sosnowskyi]|uniref:Uncharacterized protein n=1 Tax=Heracleum sosnowskyi TaxID=360622 RepID=A0AAD8M1W5_9APIA|nr:hypothetical protein POM88_049960 [Heracleum sosnowskyi]
MNVPLKHEPLRILCSTAIVSTDLSSFTFSVGDTHYTLNRDILCDALHFPRDNFVNLPSEADLIQIFTNIHYQGQIDLVKLSKSNLVSEWDLFFDTLAKVFSNCTKTNFHNIPSLLQNIGFAVANNLRINFGHLIWNHLVRRVLVAKSDHSSGRKVKCFYPRFLTIMINHVLTDEHKQLFSLVPEKQPPVDQSTHAGTEDATPLQVVFPNPGSSSHNITETQEVHRADHEFVEPKTLSQVIEPNTESTPITTQPELNVNISHGSVSGEDSRREPTALSPPLKKRKTYRETSVSPSVSSQQDMDLEMAIEQSLETSSQQDESIEIRHRAMAICTESGTLPLLTMGEDIQIDDTQDTLSGEHIGFDTVPTIVTVEVPSQASEGKSDSLPSQIESFSPLPEGTSLAPLRDFPLADLSGESGNLVSSTLKQFSFKLVLRSERQTRSDTQARELSETPLREIEAENNILKAQVVERSSSSTSVTNQLGTIKDDLEGLKGTLLPKLNAIQQSQVLVASDISDLTMSNVHISESVKEIATISANVDFILQTADENQTFNEERMSRIEGGIEHLNEGMKHLGRSEVNPDATQVKSVEDSSTKGENVEKQGEDQAGSQAAGGSGKDKGKQKLTFSDSESEEAPEDIFGDVEVEEEANYVDWEDESNVDPVFEAELVRQKADLKRREEENVKVSDIISKHLVIQKAEQQEKQRLHNLKVNERKLNVRLKLGEEWDKAREMFAHQEGTNNDGKFLGMC